MPLTQPHPKFLKAARKNFSNDEIKIIRIFFFHVQLGVDEKLLERKSDNDESTFFFLRYNFFFYAEEARKKF